MWIVTLFCTCTGVTYILAVLVSHLFTFAWSSVLLHRDEAKHDVDRVNSAPMGDHVTFDVKSLPDDDDSSGEHETVALVPS